MWRWPSRALGSVALASRMSCVRRRPPGTVMVNTNERCLALYQCRCILPIIEFGVRITSRSQSDHNPPTTDPAQKWEQYLRSSLLLQQRTTDQLAIPRLARLGPWSDHETPGPW